MEFRELILQVTNNIEKIGNIHEIYFKTNTQGQKYKLLMFIESLKESS